MSATKLSIASAIKEIRLLQEKQRVADAEKAAQASIISEKDEMSTD